LLTGEARLRVELRPAAAGDEGRPVP
jgi:hypothetical protein